VTLPEDRSAPGPCAALLARSAIEEVLLAIQDIPVDLDRHDLRDRLLRAIHCTFAVRDTPVISAAHLDGLREAASMASESRTLLTRVGDPAVIDPLRRAVERLDTAVAALREGADAVAQIQLARRHELVGDHVSGGLPPARTFRASVGLPELHAPPRPPLLPHVIMEPRAPLPAPPRPPPRTPRPSTFEELEAFANASAAPIDDDPVVDEGLPDEPAILYFEPAIAEVDALRHLGRDCLEDIAGLRNLRKPNALESWIDQGPFEQRLLDNIDAFAALGGAVLPLVSLFHAEARSPDPERAFAVALTLGCIDGSDTVGTAVMTLKQSPPEELPGWLEGFWLAPSPAIDVAMADLCTSSRPSLVALALDVLHARGRTPDDVVMSLLDRSEPEIATRVARALATALPRREAIDRLERICNTTSDDDLFLTAVESLLHRAHSPAVDILRRIIDAPTSPARGRRALPLLCLVGRAGDLDRLLAAANAAPTARLLRGLGRFGHVELLGTLLNFLEHKDKDVVEAAAEALERITGAGLRETIEEPWEIELPPEATDAGGIPVPTRRVERIVTDPAPWSAWVRDKARRLDAKRKTRGGGPFTPPQIMTELEAKTTPLERREEAALELALVTGLRFQFSPHDWVARQRRHLSELRTRVAALAVEPGAWSYGLVREAEQPAVHPPASLLGEASVPGPTIRTPNAPPGPRWPLASMTDARPLQHPAHAGSERTETGAVVAQAVGYESQSSPLLVPPLESASTERHQTYEVPEPSVDATMAMPAFVPKASLPFRPAGPGYEGRPDPRVLEQVVTSRDPVDVAETAAAPLRPQNPVLPFRNIGSSQRGTIREVEQHSSASVSSTLSTPLSPTAPPLPFRPTQLSPEQSCGQIAPTSEQQFDSTTSSTMTGPMTVIPLGPVMPFRPPADGSGPTSSLSRPTVEPAYGAGSPSSSAPSPLPGQPTPLEVENVLSLAQYASLCAELAVFPWAAEAIFQRYGLEVRETRYAVDAAWKERLRCDRGQHEAWQQMYRSYHDYWTKRGAPAG
jgi:hypothetical protein